MAGTPDATVAAASGTPDLDVELDGGGGVSQADLDAAVAALVNSSPAALDTLAELATALADDPAFAATVNAALAARPTTAQAQDLVDTHVNDGSAAHAGTAVAFTPAGSIAATTVSAALAELDSEKETPAGAQSKADAGQAAAEAASAADLASHEGAADPHAGYALESRVVNVLVTANQIKTDDAVLAVHTPTAGPNLSFPLGAAETWLFEMDVLVRGTVANDIAIQVRGPAAATGTWSGSGLAVGATGVEGDGKTVTAALGATTRTFGTVGDTAATETCVRIRGSAVGGGTAGNVEVWFAQASALPATTATVRTGSQLTARRTV